MASADVSLIGIATDWVWDRPYNLGRPVPIRSGIVGLTIQLNELGKVYVSAKAFLDSSDVRLERIGSDLHPSGNSVAQVGNEIQGARPITLGD